MPARFVFPDFTTKISDCLGGVWSKSPISHKIVPWNRISKSIEDKHFVNVRLPLNVVSAAII